MKKNCFIVFALLFCLSCEKEKKNPTIIHGTITNSTTGEPVDNASVDWIQYFNGDLNRGKESDVITNINGYYAINIPSGDKVSLVSVSKAGFLPKVDPLRGLPFTYGDTNTFNITLIPTDGYLKLIAYNDLLSNDSLFVKFFSPTKSIQYALGGGVSSETYPFVLQNGISAEVLIAFPSQEFVKVHWGTHDFISFNDAIFKDSVFIIRNDTATYSIHF